MSGNTRTAAQLKVLSGGGGNDGGGSDLLRLRPSPRFQRFLATAAEAGLEAPVAVRLGLEHALCLRDAARFAPDVEAGRRLLARAAFRARTIREMAPQQAAYLRKLTTRRPISALDVKEEVAVEVPEKVLTRVRATLPESSLHPEAVEEMISWEIAATLSGRSMGEWALLQLLRDRVSA